MSKTAAEWTNEAYEVGEKGNNKLAIEYCDKAIAVDPNYGEAYFYKAYFMPVHTDAEKMVLYQKAIDVGYVHSWTYQNLGNNYMALGRLPEAINCYQKVIELDANLNFFWSLIGLLHEQMGDKTKALEYYDLCLEKGVDLHNTYLYKGKLLSGEGKYQEALDLLSKGLAELPTHIELLYQNGKLCRILGQEAKAVEHFNKAISRTPENPNDWCNRGLSFIALGKKEEGLSDLKRTRSELETFAEITYSPGYLKFMKSTITSIVEAEELGEKSKAVEEKLLKIPAAQKFTSVLKKLQAEKDTMQNKLIGQLSQTQNAQANKNIDDFNKLKAEFEKKLMEVQAAMQQEVNQVKKDVTKLDNKVTALENNMEILKEEIDNKLDDFNKKLNTELDKQDLKPEDKEKVMGYFKAFVGTISSIHVTSQVVDSGQVQLDTGSGATTILSTLASFAPFVGDLLSSGITTIGEFMKAKELKRNARKVKGLAPDASSLSQLIGGAAYKIVIDKTKQGQIIKASDEDVKQKFANVFQKIMAFCEKLDEDLDVYLYSALYKTPSEIMGHQDANDLIEKWIKGIITPVGVQEEFVKYTLNPHLGKEDNKPKGEREQPQQSNRSGCCSMF